MRALQKVVGLLFAMVLLAVVLTGVWIVYDGGRDDFHHSDVGFVPGYEEDMDNSDLTPAVTARLDRAAVLYTEGKFPKIIVSGVTPPNENDEVEAMTNYLKEHGVPANAIIQDHRGADANDSIDTLAAIMKDQEFHSVTLVSDYFRIVRMRMDLAHDGVRDVQQAAVGQWKKDDARDVVLEEARLFNELYHWYLVPAAIQASNKADEESVKLKEKVNKELDSLHK